jgi:hypothetical protein
MGHARKLRISTILALGAAAAVVLAGAATAARTFKDTILTRLHRVTLAGLALLIAVVAAGAVAATSSAATTVRETITQPISESGLSDDCRPGITGELTGTDVLDYQSVETATGFHIQGAEGGPGRIDWSDGTYTLIDSVDRFAFNVGRGVTAFSLTHVDSGDTYAGDGTFLFRVTFHEVQHLTEANGVVRVELERGHFHFYGDC